VTGFAYPGHELELFQHARNWKQYYASQIAEYIRGDVLEVGAGIGGTSRFLCNRRQNSWTALEPDSTLAERLRASLASQPLDVPCRVLDRTLAEVQETFDTILYIDVIEHIEDDRGEAALWESRLRPHGQVIVLSPAHQWLFSPFDRAIGHYRRYTRDMLTALSPRGLELVRAWYLDSTGMLLSLANRLVLRASYPTPANIRFWDSAVVPVSRVLDRVSGHQMGKTVIAVWKKPGSRRDAE
jgi:SAM-dependent methyltransferase